MKRLVFCSVFVLTLSSGCEQMQPMLAHAGYVHDLGDFEVKRITFAQKMPDLRDGYGGGGYLKIELTSTSRLSLDYPTYWIGVASDYCPLLDDHNLIAFGHYGDGRQLGERSIAAPAKQSSDGLYRYDIYVVRAYPPPSKTLDDFGGPQTGPYAQNLYDIIDDQKDLCLQFFGGDHYNVFARSSVIRVRYDAIRNAANEARISENPATSGSP